MKKINKILSLIMAVLLMCLSMVCVSAEDIIGYNEYIIFHEDAIEIGYSIGIDEEIIPMMANGCSNYDYQDYTMNQLKVEMGWTLRMNGDNDHYKIYEGGTLIGEYHTGRNTGQQPHFHLSATPGVHYILGGI